MYNVRHKTDIEPYNVKEFLYNVLMKFALFIFIHKLYMMIYINDRKKHTTSIGYRSVLPFTGIYFRKLIPRVFVQ